jgi:hypothetical protein
MDWADLSNPTEGFSLGQIVDAILALPEGQREGLFRLLGVAPITGPIPNQARSEPQVGVAGPGPQSEANRQNTGGNRNAGGITDDGQHTVDPKTGKVFKLTPAKQRSDEFTRLQKELDESLRALKEFSDSNGINRSGNGAEKLSADLRKEYNRLISRFNAAKAALKTHKGSHREEFAAPSKGKGKQPEGR